MLCRACTGLDSIFVGRLSTNEVDSSCLSRCDLFGTSCSCPTRARLLRVPSVCDARPPAWFGRMPVSAAHWIWPWRCRYVHAPSPAPLFFPTPLPVEVMATLHLHSSGLVRPGGELNMAGISRTEIIINPLLHYWYIAPS